MKNRIAKLRERVSIRNALLLAASVTIIPQPRALGGTWSSAISNGYPGSTPTDVVTAGADVYVTDAANVFHWSATSGTWSYVQDATTTSVASRHLTVSGNNVYAFGTRTLSDTTVHNGLFCWNSGNSSWSELGTDTQMSGAEALAVGSDGFIYIGGRWLNATLPNGQTNSMICRYNLSKTDSTGWNNMLGGIWGVPSDLAGVYSLAIDSDYVKYSGLSYQCYIVYIGGEFQKTVGGALNHNVVIWETFQAGVYNPEYVSVSDGSKYGVSGYVYDCPTAAWQLFDNGIFVRNIIHTGSDVIMGGWFEESTNYYGVNGTCTPPTVAPTLNYYGMARIIRAYNGQGQTDNVYSIGAFTTVANNLDNCTCNPISNCGGDADIFALSYSGTNVFVGGGFNVWAGLCNGGGSGHRFGQGYKSGAAYLSSYVSGPATDSLGGAQNITAISPRDSSGSVYVVGSFGILDGVTSGGIIKWSP